MIYVECIEPDSLPIKKSIEVRQLERFRLFVLNDVRQSTGIRATCLMKSTENPPPEASLVMELDVYDPGAGDPLVFRVKRLGARVFTDLVRPNVRSRLAEGHEIPSGSRLELILQDTRRVGITLQLESDLMQRSDAIGGGSIRHKALKDGDAGWFLYNSFAQLVSLNATVIRARVILWLRKMGIHPAILLTLGSLGVILLMGGAIAYNRHQAAEEAEQRAESLEQAQEKAKLAAENAILGERACLAQQEAMAEKLGEIEQVKKIRAARALAFSFTQGVAVENGGGRMLAEPIQPFDEQYRSTTLKAVVQQMDMVIADPLTFDYCLEHEKVLGLDLPKYYLTWHPDTKLVCTPNYSVVDGGINRAGPWGLSERVAGEFGDQDSAEAVADESQQGSLRMYPRWSASTLAIGLREVQFALLTSDTGPRPPTVPSQAHLWTLALWDAYNRLPSPASGVMDKPVGYCIEEMITKMMDTDSTSIPGSPVLPDIVAVAEGEKEIVISPTSGCPWTDGVFQLGAQAAIKSVANYAVYLENVKEEEG